MDLGRKSYQLCRRRIEYFSEFVDAPKKSANAYFK